VTFLIDADTKIVVQGLTGATGRMAAGIMHAGHSDIVAGVTPGRSGDTVDGIPVFDTVLEAKQAGGTASILFVPRDCCATRLSRPCTPAWIRSCSWSTAFRWICPSSWSRPRGRAA